MSNEERCRGLCTLALGLVLTLGVFFRFGAIDQKLIWHDEVYTRIFAAGYSSSDWNDALYNGRTIPLAGVQHYQRHNSERGVMATVRGLAHDEPQHPPLYYILARAWVSLFGDGIGTLRSLSAIFGLLGLPAIYWLCRELFPSRRIAWTGVALLASSPFFVLYSQEAREYSLWAALLLLSTASLLRATRLTEVSDGARPQRLRAWLLYAVLTTAGLYTSFSTAPVILVHLLWLCIRERMRLNRVSLHAAGAMSFSALLFLPWVLTLWTHFDSFRASMAWASTIEVSTSDLLRTLALNLSRPLLDLWPDLLDWPAGIGVTLSLALISASLVWMSRSASRHTRTMVLLLVLVPIALLLGPDLLLGGIRSVSTRYLTPVLLGVLIAVASFLGSSSSWRHTVGTGLALAMALLSCGWNYPQEAPWTKGISCGLPEVARVVNQEAAPLVIGNREQHHPGNMLSLSNLLRPDAQMVFLPIGEEDRFDLPDGGGAVFLFSPTPPYRDGLEDRAQVRLEPVVDELHVQLWRVLPR